MSGPIVAAAGPLGAAGSVGLTANAIDPATKLPTAGGAKIMCLETIDSIQRARLLDVTKLDAAVIPGCKTTCVEQGLLWTMDPVLSATECRSIIRAAKLLQFGSLDHVYDKSIRDAERLCVIDQNLADLLWARLQPVIALLPEMTPFGFVDPRLTWKATGINPCFRISKYQAGSKGFAPHYDSQYCPANEKRSCLSVIVYLSDDKVLVGALFFFLIVLFYDCNEKNLRVSKIYVKD